VKSSLLLLFLLLFLSAAWAQAPQPIPPGIRKADQTEDRTQKNIPPPIVLRSHPDVARARREADELSKLAQTIPWDVDQIAKGLLPKDVINKLRQIEKLSKHLRSDLSP